MALFYHTRCCLGRSPWSNNTDETIAIVPKSHCKDFKGKMTSAEALTSLQWVTLHARRFGHRCCLVQDAMKGEIPEHLDVFKSTMSQQHGYNTRNGYMPVISKPRTEWGKNKTYYKAITDWASLHANKLKKLMPKRIFKHKLKQFLLDHF